MTTTYEALLEALEEEENQLTLYALGDWEEEQGNLVRAEAWRYLGKWKRYPSESALKSFGWWIMVDLLEGPEIGDHSHRSFSGKSNWLPWYWGNSEHYVSSVKNAYLLAVNEYERYRQ
jgi:hypothetical protein